MAKIYETENFILESHEKPEIDRLEGGHVKISPKKVVKDRSQFTPEQAIELMRFTIVSGQAMINGMKKQGVDIGRINYQDNGNWTPNFHIHLYCRAIDAKIQKFGDPIIPGHKESFKSLNQEDINIVKTEIDKLFLEERFSDLKWKLN